jgi:hypothetical protein
MCTRRFLLILGFLLASCATSYVPNVWVNYSSINTAPRPLPPRGPATVEVYLSGPPARPHADVGLLRATEDGASIGQMTDALRARAARAGCDAIVITGVGDRPYSVARGWVDSSQTLAAACLVYTDASAAREAQERLSKTGLLRPGVAGEPCEHIAAMHADRCDGGLVCRNDICVPDDDAVAR